MGVFKEIEAYLPELNCSEYDMQQGGHMFPAAHDMSRHDRTLCHWKNVHIETAHLRKASELLSTCDGSVPFLKRVCHCYQPGSGVKPEPTGSDSKTVSAVAGSS